MKLDFSEFHPLDHWPGTADCRRLYGGTRHHLAIAWEYRHRENLVRPFAYLFRCLRGRHRITVWASGDEMGAGCLYCSYEREATAEEKAQIPKIFFRRDDGDYYGAA